MRATPPSAISMSDSKKPLIAWLRYSDSSARKCAAAPSAGDSGGIPRFPAREQGVDRAARAGAAQLGHGLRVAEDPADPGERLQMVGARIGRRKQKKNKIHRQIV